MNAARSGAGPLAAAALTQPGNQDSGSPQGQGNAGDGENDRFIQLLHSVPP